MIEEIDYEEEIAILKAKNKALLSFIKMTFLAGGGTEEYWEEIEKEIV